MVRIAFSSLIIAAALGATAQTPENKPQTLGTIVRKHEKFDELVPRGAAIEKLAFGFDWAEGPVWVKSGNYLLFSDIPKNTIWKWSANGGISLFLKPSGYTGKARFLGREPGSNGLTLDGRGDVVLCRHGDRDIARRSADGTITMLAGKFDGKRFNSPNDLAYKSNGDLYFTDPPYGLPKTFDDPARELDFCGVYRLDKNGLVTLLTKEMSAPNGLAFSPDEKTLYLANSDPKQANWRAFAVNADGTLGASRIFFDASEWAKAGKPGLPDGLKVDMKGNLFATGPGGVHVFAPDATLLGTLETGVPTANCAWGDDGATLYITANDHLCRVKTTTRGILP